MTGALQSPLALFSSTLVAGVDEAGRGPLAGPVTAAAVILDSRRVPEGLADSKVLSSARRQSLAALIRERALAWSVAWADPAEIDAVNILQATYLAMGRAVAGLRIRPDHVQVDGNGLVLSESAASARSTKNTVATAGNQAVVSIRSIAEEAGTPMPSFFGYILKYSLVFLIPCFIITTVVFF